MVGSWRYKNNPIARVKHIADNSQSVWRQPIKSTAQFNGTEADTLPKVPKPIITAANVANCFGGNSLAMVARYRMGELSTRAMVHEFGHAFVNLGDEYENDLQAADYTERPNIDSEGCPKWCSGELNEEADCYDEYLEFRTCLYNATNNLTEEYSEECNYNNILTNCNLGKDCQEGTGCYFNAKSVIAFRSSERSIMKYPSEDPFEFNTISKEAILNKINSLSE